MFQTTNQISIFHICGISGFRQPVVQYLIEPTTHWRWTKLATWLQPDSIPTIFRIFLKIGKSVFQIFTSLSQKRTTQLRVEVHSIYKPSSYWGTPIDGNPHIHSIITSAGLRPCKRAPGGLEVPVPRYEANGSNQRCNCGHVKIKISILMLCLFNISGVFMIIYDYNVYTIHRVSQIFTKKSDECHLLAGLKPSPATLAKAQSAWAWWSWWPPILPPSLNGAKWSATSLGLGRGCILRVYIYMFVCTCIYIYTHQWMTRYDFRYSSRYIRYRDCEVSVRTLNHPIGTGNQFWSISSFLWWLGKKTRWKQRICRC